MYSILAHRIRRFSISLVLRSKSPCNTLIYKNKLPLNNFRISISYLSPIALWTFTRSNQEKIVCHGWYNYYKMYRISFFNVLSWILKMRFKLFGVVISSEENRRLLEIVFHICMDAAVYLGSPRLHCHLDGRYYRN